MRIGYVLSWRGGRRTGPFKKIIAQATAWSAQGHDVRLFVTTSAGAAHDWASAGLDTHIATADGGPQERIRAERRVHRAVQSWRPDVVYLRHGIWVPGQRRLVRSFPTVVEINGDEVAVARQRSRLRGCWAALTRSWVLSAVDGAVFMTSELASMPRFTRYSLPHVVIPNGVDLAATPELPPTSAETPRLLLLGHPDSPWHGTDKLAGLAQRHPTWQIDVIGPVPGDVGSTIPANLALHPELTTEEYLPIAAEADVGLGSLAMHRIGVCENPALKVREYLALGLAVISCRDPDFTEPVDYFLEIGNTEDNVEAADQQIVEFIERWHGRRVDRATIAHLDTSVKEGQRLAFMQHVVHRATGE